MSPKTQHQSDSRDGRVGGRLHWRRIANSVVLSGLLLAGCSNSGSDSQSAVSSPPTVSDAPPPAGASPSSDVPRSSAESDTPAPDVSVSDTIPDDVAGSVEPDLGEFQSIEGVPGVSDEEIRFAVLGTGPSNPLGYCLLECYSQGVEAYFQYRNSLGGVHGRQLVVSDVVDDEVGNTQVKLLELIDADVLGVFAAPLVYSGYADAGAAGLPLYTTVPAAAESNGIDSIFLTTGTGCISCPSRLNVQAAILAGASKVGSIGYGVSQASKDCVSGHSLAFEKWGAAVGIEHVYANSELAFGMPNGLGPEVTAMKEAGVDFVLTCVDSNGALTLEQELERQGMGDIPISLPQGYGDGEFARSNADLIEGDLMSVFFHPFEAVPPNPMLQTFSDSMEAAGYAPNDYSIQGWINADLAVTGLLATGPQFDRASLVAATNRITDYTAGGMIATIDWTKQHNAPTIDDPLTNAPPLLCSAFVALRGGTFELLGEPAKPFFCFDPKVEEWVDATPMAFG